MCGCESWTVKKAECRRIDAFELWCWRRLLRVPWTARRSNPSILKEISPGISLEGMMLMLKLQYFGHRMRRVASLEQTLMLGGIGGRRRGDDSGWDGWMASVTRWTWIWVYPGSWWWTGRPGVLWFMGSQRVGHDWATELNWTDGNINLNWQYEASLIFPLKITRFCILSRLVISFLPRSKHLLISWLQSPSAVILEPPKNKVWHCFHCFLIYFPWSNGTGCHDLHFLNVEL